MNTPVFSGRRAERFAQLLDDLDAGHTAQSRTSPAQATPVHATPVHAAPSHAPKSPSDAELNKLAAVGHRLSSIEFDLQIEPEFRAGLRAMLMATIERKGIGATAVDAEPARPSTVRGGKTTHQVLPGRRHRRPAAPAPAWYAPVRSKRARGAILIGLAAGTLAVSGMSVASGDAIPGDTLYGIKRSTERAQLALAGSEVGRGQLYLEFAKTRANEAVGVLDDQSGLYDVMFDLDAETRQGVRLLNTAAVDHKDAAPLDVVDAFVIAQRQTLVDIQSGLHGVARDRVDVSITLLDQISHRSAQLRATLTCDGLGRDVDTLGPLAGSCIVQRPATARSNSGGGATATQASTEGAGTQVVVPTPAPSAPPSASPSTSTHNDGRLPVVGDTPSSVLPT